MRIQLVHFEGCPNVEAARDASREVLAKHHITVPIETVCTSAADAPPELRSWGSPTILVNGLDVGGEPGPGGSSCRLYRGPNGRIRGFPPPSLIEAAVMRARSRGAEWVRSLAMVPGAALSLLPSLSCPACVAAYAGVLSSLGLGFALTERVLVPVILALLVIGVAGVAWSTRSHHHAGPLVATLLGANAVVVGRLIWRLPPVLYVGIALLVAASMWNLWLKRPRRPRLIQLRTERPA